MCQSAAVNARGTRQCWHKRRTSRWAVWSSGSPDFGINGILDRFGQIEPVVLFCAEGYDYNGKNHSSLEVAAELAARVPTIRRIVVLPHLDDALDLKPAGDKAVRLADYVAPFAPREPEFARVGFNEPLYIMFSSGTTGLPKCIVHSVGGTLVQHLKEHMLHCDEKPGERLMYFTTLGWMMWNWQVSALAAGVTLVQYDGSPFFPDGNRLLDIAAAEKVTHFGTSAKFVDACAKAGINPAKSHDLGAMRSILSTGSPLAPEGFEYIYRDWKADLCLSSIAGGTDIIACFVGGSPVDPVHSGTCQKRMLGMDVAVFDDAGKPLEGEPGELVCRNAHPSMPAGFWNDADGSRYHAAYFARFDNVWHHGDWVELTPEGGMIFYGRSDATLNPGGVRIGTAEIYRQVERLDEVLEALVIGQAWHGDVRVVLFVRLRAGVSLSDALVKHIKTEIRKNASPRHVPAKVIAVADIPRTKSGKITELAVRDVVHGRAVRNAHALANPEALELFGDLKELQD
ncbi:MAG: acetoacetate--CoA ligase [Paracoccaceae bacterium]